MNQNRISLSLFLSEIGYAMRVCMEHMEKSAQIDCVTIT